MITLPSVSAFVSSLAIHAGVLAVLALPMLGHVDAPQQAIEVSYVMPSEVQSAQMRADLPPLAEVELPQGHDAWLQHGRALAHTPPDIAVNPHPRAVAKPSQRHNAHKQIVSTGTPHPQAQRMVSAAYEPMQVARPLHNPTPQYPATAREGGVQGRVMVQVRVSADGTPQHIKIIRSSGHATLDTAAANSIHQWRFAPAVRGVQSIASTVIVPVDFRLN